MSLLFSSFDISIFKRWNSISCMVKKQLYIRISPFGHVWGYSQSICLVRRALVFVKKSNIWARLENVLYPFHAIYNKWHLATKAEGTTTKSERSGCESRSIFRSRLYCHCHSSHFACHTYMRSGNSFVTRSRVAQRRGRSPNVKYFPNFRRAPAICITQKRFPS